MGQMEQEHGRPQDETVPQRWDSAGLGEALRVLPSPITDVAYGDGHEYAIGDLRLAIFPTTRVARLTSPDARLELYRQDPPTISEDGVVFARADRPTTAGLMVDADGFATYLINPADSSEPSESSQAPVSAPDTLDVSPAGQAAVQEDSGTRQQHSLDPSPAPTPPSLTTDDDKQERVTLQGRVGRMPALRTTRTGKTVAQFPLAVRDEQNNTTWHTIVAFDERAKKLQEAVKKGDPVQVIGYKHVKEQQGKDGKLKRVEEIYAVVVKPR